MRSPRPPPPMNEARVALATTSTAAVRIPARTSGYASGHSIRRRICRAVIPIPRAASRTVSGTPRSPSSVFTTIGGSASITSARSAGQNPSPR